MLAAAIGTVTLSGVSVSAALVGGSSSASAAPSTTCPAGASLQIPAGGSNSQATCVISSTGTPVGGDQARVADHPGEQVLRLDVHRAQPEQLPLADPAPAGRAADQLLRHRPLQHGQLHLAGVGPVPVLRRTGRLLDDGEHDQQQQRHHHHRHGRYRHRHRPDGRPKRNQHQRPHHLRRRATATTGSSSSTAGWTPRWRTTGASTRPGATLFNQFNAAGVSWKGYAQDLGGAQPTGSTTYVAAHAGAPNRPRAVRTGRAATRAPTHDPVTNPTNLVAPRGNVTSFTGAQPANASNNGDPADQFVAKHFPFPWFTP